MNIPFDSYETVIGFECHVQLLTRSKLFSSGPNTFGAPCNTLVDVVDAGLPGVLPVINKKAVEFAIKLGAALGCTINRESVFSRKHYFYPDLPKGYQISQFDKPICEHGKLEFLVDGVVKSIRIRRIHIEEDAGKNTHIDGSNASYVDFNRAGTPLLEVVSEPDLRNPVDTMAACKALRQLVTFLDICDGNMEEGSLRADINVSVRKVGDTNLGTRTETKNLNSFRYLGQAISFESRRQIIEIESGKKITQETRLWDPNSKESRPMRSKEEAHDYRYFPDPDLLPLKISDEMLGCSLINLPEMPLARFRRYREDFGLNEYDAQMLISDRNLSLYFEDAIKDHANAKGIANWIINDVLRTAKESGDIEEGVGFHATIPALSIASIVKMIDEGKISSSIGKKIFALLEKSPNRSPVDIVAENKWQVVGDDETIRSFVAQVLRENPAEVTKYKEGKTKVFGFLMGQLMKVSGGQLDPKRAHELMVEGLASAN